ncbi:MAG: SLBB domain-containing protein [Gemmatimonadales bacterium]
MATRAELQAALTEAEQMVNSRAYSDELRDQKEQELALLKDRLEFGDFRVGDQLQIVMSVPVAPGQAPINGLYTIGPGQMLELPGLPAISMAGVLRSEAETHLSEQFARLFKDQTVQVTPLVRLSLLGGVGNPGFYQVPADLPLPEVIMLAGGPVSNVEYERSEIRRGGEEIWEGEEVALAIQQGATPDQLNLRAGDELEVGAAPTRNWLQTLRTFAIIPGLILSFYGLGRLAGIF